MIFKTFCLLFLFTFLSACSSDLFEIDTKTAMTEQHTPPDISFNQTVEQELSQFNPESAMTTEQNQTVINLQNIPPMESEWWREYFTNFEGYQFEDIRTTAITIDLPKVGIVMIPYRRYFQNKQIMI